MLKKVALFFLLIIIVLACSTIPAVAFDGNDYDGGSDDSGWDSGGWDSDSGRDWDSDSGSSGGSGGRSGGSSSSEELEGVYLVIGLAIIFVPIILIVLFVSITVKNARKRRAQTGAVRRSSDQGMRVQLPDRTWQIEGIVRARDPNFSAGDFITFTKRVYIDIETAWCKRDMTTVRVFLHDNLYDATVRQVQAKIDQGVVYHYESMVVNTAYITSYARDGQFEYITVYLNARRIDWQEDEKTGKILRGDKTTRWDLRYKMKFMRSAGVLTKGAVSATTGHNCPNCGALLEMTSSAKCAYCGSTVTTGQYSWVLADYGTVRNDTVDEGIKV